MIISRQPEHNLVTCLAHLEYRGLHCIVLQLLDTNIRQVLIMRITNGKVYVPENEADDDDGLNLYDVDHDTYFVPDVLFFTQVIFRNGRRGLSPWATNKFGKDLLVALDTLHKVQK